MFYGKSEFISLRAFLKNNELDNLEAILDTSYARICMKCYLQDCGYLDCIESLVLILRNYDLVKTEFMGKYELDPIECDCLMSQTEACDKVLKLAMATYLRIDQIFTENFLDQFYIDLNLLLEDLRTINSIYDKPYDEDKATKLRCQIL